MFPIAFTPAIAALHSQVRSDVFWVVNYTDATGAYIQILEREKNPRTNNVRLYEALSDIIINKKVPEREILRYIEEEFTTPYERVMLYAIQEWASMFDRAGIRMLWRAIKSLISKPEGYHTVTLHYTLSGNTHDTYTIETSETDRDYTPRAIIWALRYIIEENPYEKISIEAITLK